MINFISFEVEIFSSLKGSILFKLYLPFSLLLSSFSTFFMLNKIISTSFIFSCLESEAFKFLIVSYPSISYAPNSSYYFSCSNYSFGECLNIEFLDFTDDILLWVEAWLFIWGTNYGLVSMKYLLSKLSNAFPLRNRSMKIIVSDRINQKATNS